MQQQHSNQGIKSYSLLKFLLFLILILSTLGAVTAPRVAESSRNSNRRLKEFDFDELNPEGDDEIPSLIPPTLHKSIQKMRNMKYIEVDRTDQSPLPRLPRQIFIETWPHSLQRFNPKTDLELDSKELPDWFTVTHSPEILTPYQTTQKIEQFLIVNHFLFITQGNCLRIINIENEWDWQTISEFYLPDNLTFHHPTGLTIRNSIAVSGDTLIVHVREGSLAGFIMLDISSLEKLEIISSDLFNSTCNKSETIKNIKHRKMIDRYKDHYPGIKKIKYYADIAFRNNTLFLIENEMICDSYGCHVDKSNLRAIDLENPQDVISSQPLPQSNDMHELLNLKGDLLFLYSKAPDFSALTKLEIYKITNNTLLQLISTIPLGTFVAADMCLLNSFMFLAGTDPNQKLETTLPNAKSPALTFVNTTDPTSPNHINYQRLPILFGSGPFTAIACSNGSEISVATHAGEHSIASFNFSSPLKLSIRHPVSIQPQPQITAGNLQQLKPGMTLFLNSFANFKLMTVDARSPSAYLLEANPPKNLQRLHWLSAIGRHANGKNTVVIAFRVVFNNHPPEQTQFLPTYYVNVGEVLHTNLPCFLFTDPDRDFVYISLLPNNKSSLSVDVDQFKRTISVKAPTENDVGENNFVLQADDKHQGKTNATLTIFVNRPPIPIVKLPKHMHTKSGKNLIYNFTNTYQNPKDGGPVTYKVAWRDTESLLPDDLEFKDNVLWSRGDRQHNFHDQLTLRVTNRRGGEARHDFVLTVYRPPKPYPRPYNITVFLNKPHSEFLPNLIIGPDPNTLTYSLNRSHLKWLEFRTPGNFLAANPKDPGDVGAHVVYLKAEDPYGNSAKTIINIKILKQLPPIDQTPIVITGEVWSSFVESLNIEASDESDKQFYSFPERYPIRQLFGNDGVPLVAYMAYSNGTPLSLFSDNWLIFESNTLSLYGNPSISNLGVTQMQLIITNADGTDKISKPIEIDIKFNSFLALSLNFFGTAALGILLFKLLNNFDRVRGEVARIVGNVAGLFNQPVNGAAHEHGPAAAAQPAQFNNGN